MIDVPETEHRHRERGRLHAEGRRTDDNSWHTLLLIHEADGSWAIHGLAHPATPLVGSDDPWIAGYLKLRQAVLTGDIETPDEVAAYAAELRRDLPDGPPPPSIAAFVTADIKITFPLLTDQLWTP